MERVANLNILKDYFRENYLGPDALNSIREDIGLSEVDIEKVLLPDKRILNTDSSKYILIYGNDISYNEENYNLNYQRHFFGINPEINEPCFYNQDWYLREHFSKITLKREWYLLKKEIYPELSGKIPSSIESLLLPKAILCSYTFFAYFFLNKQKLWDNVFVWCDDYDDNNDQIYVGRYTDPNGISKNGFNIHRHLRLTNKFSFIDNIRF